MDISVYPHEKEILFPAFSHFFIETVNEDAQGNTVVQMKFIQPKDAGVSKAPMQLPDEDESDGPVVIRMTKGCEGLHGVAQVLQDQLALLDPHMDFDAGCDSKNFWAQVFFSSSELAARAIKRFHHSVIGHFEIAALQFSVATDKCPFRCLVQVTLTATPHTALVSSICTIKLQCSNCV
jgi:hypothetical protein